MIPSSKVFHSENSYGISKYQAALCSIVFAFLLAPSAFPQQQSGARLLFPIVEVALEVSTPTKETPPLTVLSTVVRQTENRRIIMQRVADPGLPDFPLPPLVKSNEQLEAELEVLRASPEWQEQPIPSKETKILLISATVVDGKATFIRWHHEGEEFQAWSNVNFKYLTGFAHFETDDFRYEYVMAVGDIHTYGDQTSEWPGKPPELGVNFPAFTLVKGDATKIEAIRMMEDLHELYENERIRLIAEYEARILAESERQAWLKANPPQPKDTVIQFWPRKGSHFLEATPTEKEGN